MYQVIKGTPCSTFARTSANDHLVMLTRVLELVIMIMPSVFLNKFDMGCAAIISQLLYSPRFVSADTKLAASATAPCSS